MTAGSLFPPRWWKEIRGLSPAWLACLATMAVAASLGSRMWAVGLFAYFLGTVALGGLSVGHEYNCRTLPLLLSQPASRARLFLEKLSVLASMLLVLCGVAWLALFDPDTQWGLGARWTRTWWVVTFGLPLLCGLFVAPWMTMVCRNALAGIVFALAIPATVWLASDMASATAFGAGTAATVDARELALGIFWRGMLIVSAIAAVAGWRMFIGLEAIESRGVALSLPAWVSGRARAIPEAPPAFARRPAMWLLVKKELRLQQLTFAVSGLYVMGWVSLLAFGPFAPASRTTLLFMLTVFHSGAIPLLAGSLASAEERHLGTLEWQTLLPMARWKQWMTKAVVALGIALTLTLGLPALLYYISPIPGMGTGEAGPGPALGWAVILVVVASLYISSVCTSGLRALLISVPAVCVVLGLTSPYHARWYWALSTWSGSRFWVYSQPEMFGASAIIYMASLDVLAIVVYAGALGMLLRYAMTNHHSAEGGTARAWKQMSTLVVFLAIGISLWSGAFGLFAAEMTERIRLMMPG